VTALSLAIEIIQLLRESGHRAYFVGGCVRDRLLGGNPKDYDIATNARPDEILRYFPEAGIVGAHFGVVLVCGARGVHVEVATFRSDHSYSDGRRPDHVEFETDPRQDVLRRDFTINALLEDPLTGEVFDYVGGRQDLQEGIIRAIGDPIRRFGEDRLRMLRAIRFAARLSFEIEGRTFAAIRQMAPLIHDIAAERVRDELMRVLTEGNARRGFELLDRSNLLAEILPEVKAMQGVAQPPEFHPEGDVWTHTLLMLEKMEYPSLTLAMGVLLHDVGKPPTFRVAERIRFDGHVEAGVEIGARILERLKFSRDDADQILALISNHMRFKDVQAMRESTLKRFLRLPQFDEHLELHRLDCLASHGHLDNWEFVNRKRAALPAEDIRPPRLLTGQDLIAEGFQPGPAFGKALEEVETAQLEGQIRTKEEALRIARMVLTGA
jgi:poly(A) polymerase